MDMGNIHLWAMWLRFEVKTQNQCLYQGHESCCDAMHPNCSNDCENCFSIGQKKREKKTIRRKKTKNKSIIKNVSDYVVYCFCFLLCASFVLQGIVKIWFCRKKKYLKNISLGNVEKIKEVYCLCEKNHNNSGLKRNSQKL